MRVLLLLAAAMAVAALAASPRGAVSPPGTLEIYAIDVEGGKATLVVLRSTEPESFLIDTGNIGEQAARDAERILSAIGDAGLTRIDHLVTTHWHRDHVGAMPLIAARLPILEFIDHGDNVQPDPPVDAFLTHDYPKLYAMSKHRIVKPGDQIGRGVDVRVVASAGEAVKTPLPGGGMSNPSCAGFVPRDPDPTENAQSIGLHIAFGRFRLVDLGDLTVNKEFELMCPTNPLGAADLFMVSRHGQTGSNADVLVHALQPRVAILNNGTRKGGQPDVMNVIFSAPGLEDLWQLHFSALSGQEFSPPGLFIANRLDMPQSSVPLDPVPEPASAPGVSRSPGHEGSAHWIKVSARLDGSFTVTNSRNGFSKTYPARTPSRTARTSRPPRDLRPEHL